MSSTRATWLRAVSESRSSAIGVRARTLNGSSSRMPRKPECISATIDRARARAPRSVGPTHRIAPALAHVLDDGEAVPHRDAVVDEHRHPARRVEARDRLRGAGAVERDADLLEVDAALAQMQPRAQRPGGVVLVADDELHVRVLSRWRPAILRGGGRRGYHANVRTRRHHPVRGDSPREPPCLDRTRRAPFSSVSRSPCSGRRWRRRRRREQTRPRASSSIASSRATWCPGRSSSTCCCRRVTARPASAIRW